MAYAPSEYIAKPHGNGKIIGCFKHKDNDNIFEFTDGSDETPWKEFPHLVWFKPVFGDKRDSRFAMVKKTVVELVIDENNDGTPVTIKLKIKGYKNYRELGNWKKGVEY